MDLDDLDMCTQCKEDEEYDFGLCITCYEEVIDYQHRYPLTFMAVYANLRPSTTTTKE